MAKLIYSAIASLDGYVADENGSFDWSAPDPEVHAFVNELERPIGTYLYGRRLYEVMLAWETLPTASASEVERDYAEIWRAAEKVVYSTTLTTVSSARTRIEPSFDPAAIRALKTSARRVTSPSAVRRWPPRRSGRAWSTRSISSCARWSWAAARRRFRPACGSGSNSSRSVVSPTASCICITASPGEHVVGGPGVWSPAWLIRRSSSVPVRPAWPWRRHSSGAASNRSFSSRPTRLLPSWRSRYDGLRLHTVRWLSGMPGAPMPRRLGPWVRRDDFVGYLEDYARRSGIEPEFGVEVYRIERDPAGWRVETSRGVRHARTVVVATGYCREPRIPDWPGIESFPGSFVHSAAYREPSGYAGQAVLVVGAGNSAAEIAVEVAGVATEVRFSVRTPPNIVRRDTLGIPSQLAGLAMRRLPERALDPLVGTLRRLTVPDLSGAGLPAPPGDGFTQFLRSKTIPILDHGFVDAVRDGRIRVVAEIESDERAGRQRWSTVRACSRRDRRCHRLPPGSARSGR